MLKERITKDCGCVELKQQLTEGPYLAFNSTIEKMCKEHTKEQKKKKEEEKKFNKFPNKKSTKIFEILNTMIDKLYENGVDVSYFPTEAMQTLKEYAIKIAKEK